MNQKQIKEKKIKKVNIIICGAYDLISEIHKMQHKQKTFKYYQDKPKRLKGVINKLDIDIGAYKKGLFCILEKCDKDTVSHFRDIVKYKYPDFDIEGLIKEMRE